MEAHWYRLCTKVVDAAKECGSNVASCRALVLCVQMLLIREFELRQVEYSRFKPPTRATVFCPETTTPSLQRF